MESTHSASQGTRHRQLASCLQQPVRTPLSKTRRGALSACPQECRALRVRRGRHAERVEAEVAWCVAFNESTAFPRVDAGVIGRDPALLGARNLGQEDREQQQEGYQNDGVP